MFYYKSLAGSKKFLLFRMIQRFGKKDSTKKIWNFLLKKQNYCKAFKIGNFSRYLSKNSIFSYFFFRRFKV